MHKIYYQLESSNTLESDKEIVFIGDSFTWGQGLYLNEWKENRPETFDFFYNESNEMEHHIQWTSQQPFVTKEDLILKNNLSFTNIVANSLNRKCYKRKHNGGSISANKQILESFCKLESEQRDVIMVFQFTSLSREDFSYITDEEINRYHLKYHKKDIIISNILNDRIFEIYNSINILVNNLENRFGWSCYYLDWLGDFGKFDNNRFIDIDGNKSFLDLVSNMPIKIEYKDKVFFDYHLNERGNQILADSILKKINLENS